MSRASKLISLAAIAFAAMSCGGSEQKAADVAKLEGTLAAPSSEVIIGMIDVDRLVFLDTLATDEAGKFSFEMEVRKGNPEFVYVFNEGTKVASLILDGKDSVAMTIDAEGNTLIEGSEESVKFMQIEKEHAEMLAIFEGYAAELENAKGAKYDKVAAKMAEEYRRYNRKSAVYAMQNCRSITAIPVLYRTLGELPVFGQVTDAILFSTVADSLSAAYPRSRYVKSFKEDAAFRLSQLELQRRIDNADEVGYFDIELPGLDGSMKKLSDINSKVVVLYFWTAGSAQQNNFNVDFLKKLYNDYHKKGLEIYQVSLDTDKVMWATTVMGQDLPWTNVCDIRGAASPYAQLYNLQAVPAAFIISNDELVDGEIVDNASFRKLVDKLLMK